MRIVPAAAVPASPASVPIARDHASPTSIVCTALMLALVFLALRIAGGLVALVSPSFPDCSSIGDSVDRSCPIPDIRAG
jgi:hypothetical protein